MTLDRQAETDKEIGMYIKALSHVEDAPAARRRWGIDATEYTAQKIFPKTYKDLQTTLQEYGEYQTPVPVPPLDEEYDWKGTEYTVLLWLTIRRPDGTWFHALLNQAVVWIMNNDGGTIDRINI